MLRIRFVVVVVAFFLQVSVFSFEIITNMVTPEVVGSRTENTPKAGLVIPRSLKMADP